MNSIDIDVIRTALDWQSRGQRVVMGTVVRTWGSSPRPVGSIMALCQDGSVVGSVSGGCIEDDLIYRFTRAYAPAAAPAAAPVGRQQQQHRGGGVGKGRGVGRPLTPFVRHVEALV